MNVILEVLFWELVLLLIANRYVQGVDKRAIVITPAEVMIQSEKKISS